MVNGLATGQAHCQVVQYQITREQAAWAFEAGDPFRVIASLDLLAELFGVILFVPENLGQDLSAGSVESAVATDNQ